MTQDSNIRIETMSAEDLAQDVRWWDIYHSAFPPEEREQPEIIVNSLHTGVGLAIRLRDHDQTIGIASLHLLRNPAALFLVYLAVGKNQRGQGFGRRLFDFSWHYGITSLEGRGAVPRGMIWEVDSPDLAETRQERERREQRIEFFRHLGGELLERPYIQPPVNGVSAVPMCLMYRPVSEQKSSLDSSILEELVRAIYFEKYGAVNGIPLHVLSKTLGGKA